MALKIIVWGTGNVGRPAIRAVLSHSELELVGVIVASRDKVGRDAGDIAGVGSTGVIATDDWRSVLDAGADAVVYTATADIRPVEAMADLLACRDQCGFQRLLHFFASRVEFSGSPAAGHRCLCPQRGLPVRVRHRSGLGDGYAARCPEWGGFRNSGDSYP